MNPMNNFMSLCRSHVRWNLISLLVRHSSTSSETIVIPKRIRRGPTDILRALESTVQRDYTAPEFKFHDDPFLIPTSNSAKRSYALSKESGRKAALWIRKEHAEFFDQKLADPPIKAFIAKPAITEASEASEDILKNLIDEVSVTDAITVYQILEKKEQEISDDVKLSFLELLSFYNCTEPVSEDFFEERWFRQSVHGRQKPRKTWKDGSLAEKIYESVSSGPYAGEARRALLQGMARHGQAERAWQIFRDMTASGDPTLAPDTGCYNAIISVTPFLKDGSESRWEFVESMLLEMASRGLQPNLNTLNAVLEVLSSMGFFRKAEELALRTLAEFHQLGIEPCLASYYYILMIFCKDRGPRSYVLADILKKLDGKAITTQDPKDVFFFVTAMEVCRHHLQDVELAHRVHNFLLSHSNYDLIGDSYKESVYYRNYFILMCTMEPLEKFMEVYNKLVPTVYIPEPVVMEEILKAIDLNGAMEFLPRMWSDMIIFDQTQRESLLSSLLDIMARNPVSTEDAIKNQELKDAYMRIAWGVWDKIEEENENVGIRSKNLVWTGSMLGDVMTVCLQCGEFDKAWQALLRLGADEGMSVLGEDYEPPPIISGIPGIRSLSLFVDASIKEGNITRGISCVKYAADAGFPEAGELGKRLSEGLQLNSIQKGQLTNAVGVLRTDSSSTHTDSVRKSIVQDKERSES